MTIEEKAKAYDKALQKAKYLHEAAANGRYDIEVKTFECLFPELKESEDERIKKEILELVSISGNGNQFEEIKAWLEKQAPKSKWTEEDKELLQRCCCVVTTNYYSFKQCNL